MSDQAELARIAAELAALRTRVDALNDPRLDALSGRLVGAEAVLRPLTRAGAALLERAGS